MKKSDQMNKSVNIWRNLVESHLELMQAMKKVFEGDVDRVSLLKFGFAKGDIPTLLYVASYMNPSELMGILDELVKLSTTHGYAHSARKIIKSLPREQVLKNLEAITKPMLENGIGDDYRRILELYSELDRTLTLRLARFALDQDDEDVVEAGEDFIELLTRQEQNG